MTVNVKGYKVEIDEEDVPVSRMSGWCPSISGGKVYFHKTRNGKTLLLHRVIVGAVRGQEVDHVDGNTLNNRKGNLRFSTHSQNLFNSGKPKHNTSGFKGVTWNKKNNVWEAKISSNGHTIWLGYFPDPRRAGEAYKKAAIKIAGEFARW